MKKNLVFLFPFGYGILSAIFATSSLYIMSLVVAVFDSYLRHPLLFMAVCVIICILCLMATIFLVVKNFKIILESDCKENEYKPIMATEILETALIFFAFIPLIIELFKLLAPLF